MPHMKYEVVIFDFDGTIGITMEDNYQAWSKTFDQFNVSLSREEYFLMEGMNARTVAETILKKNNIDPGLAVKIAQLKEQYYLEDNSFEFYPGVLELINALRGRFRLGLVSGAGTERMRNTVTGEFLENFEVVITGDAVENSKPNPECYLLAAKILSVPPQECLAVENSPLGIESAKRACMDCVAVCSTLDRKHLGRADFVVDDISALYTFLSA
jgi:HAD superfamily hydrolase (TIGR01509 family)